MLLKDPLSVSIPARATQLSDDLQMHLSLHRPGSLLRSRTVGGPGALHITWPRVSPQILYCIFLVLRKFLKVKHAICLCCRRTWKYHIKCLPNYF